MPAGRCIRGARRASEAPRLGAARFFKRESRILRPSSWWRWGGLEPPEPLHALFSGSFRANCRKIVVRYRSLGRLAWSLLAGHRDAVEIFDGDQVAFVDRSDVELHPFHFAIKLVAAFGIVVAYRRSRPNADVARFVRRKYHWHRVLDAAFAALFPVEVEGHGAALPQTAAVVDELRPQVVFAGGYDNVTVHFERLDSREIIAVRRFASFCVKRPSSKLAALRNDHTFGVLAADDELRGNGMRFVLEVENGVLAKPPHRPEQQLSLALDEHRTSG